MRHKTVFLDYVPLGSAAVGTQNLVVWRKSHGSTKKQEGKLIHILVYDKEEASCLVCANNVFGAILNHAPTGEYRARFFPRENRMCPACNVVQTREHILSSCIRYRRSRRNFLEFLINSAHPETILYDFLSDNPSAFTFAARMTRRKRTTILTRYNHRIYEPSTSVAIDL
jgi:hypothetical protein